MFVLTHEIQYLAGFNISFLSNIQPFIGRKNDIFASTTVLLIEFSQQQVINHFGIFIMIINK